MRACSMAKTARWLERVALGPLEMTPVSRRAAVSVIAVLALAACGGSGPDGGGSAGMGSSSAAGTPVSRAVGGEVRARLGLDEATSVRVQELVGGLSCESFDRGGSDPQFLTWLCVRSSATVSVQVYRTRQSALENARGFLDEKLVAYVADDVPMVLGGKSAADIVAVTGGSDAFSRGVYPEASAAASSAGAGQMVVEAERVVKDQLPDIPIWKGVTFKGVLLDEHTVCVDRTYPAGGGLDHRGGSAGYVTVTFPDKVLGEPQDGTCAKASVPTATVQPRVEVPAELQGKPGLVTRTDLGEQWPLTVDYAVLHCQPKEAGGYHLQLATLTAPDGTLYALNGSAKAHTPAKDIEPIWAPDPATKARISIGPLIDKALTL